MVWVEWVLELVIVLEWRDDAVVDDAVVFDVDVVVPDDEPREEPEEFVVEPEDRESRLVLVEFVKVRESIKLLEEADVVERSERSEERFDDERPEERSN